MEWNFNPERKYRQKRSENEITEWKYRQKQSKNEQNAQCTSLPVIAS